jgi:capsular polysaccharide biosynthesis protein
MQVQGQIQNYPCNATRAIYVPKDPSIRKVLIIHNETGHNHPMPTLIKVSFGLKDTYRQCIEAHGVLGATVSKIDNGMYMIFLRSLFHHSPPRSTINENAA